MGIDYRARAFLGFRVSDDDLTSPKALALGKALGIDLELSGEEAGEDVGQLLADETYQRPIVCVPYAQIDDGDSRDGWLVGAAVGGTGSSRGGSFGVVPAPTWSSLVDDATPRVARLAVAAGFDDRAIVLLTQLQIS